MHNVNIWKNSAFRSLVYSLLTTHLICIFSLFLFAKKINENIANVTELNLLSTTITDKNIGFQLFKAGDTYPKRLTVFLNWFVESFKANLWIKYNSYIKLSLNSYCSQSIIFCFMSLAFLLCCCSRDCWRVAIKWWLCDFSFNHIITTVILSRYKNSYDLRLCCSPSTRKKACLSACRWWN